MFYCPSLLCREVVAVLEDRSSTGQHVRMPCILQGPCVDVALQGYQAVANGPPAFMVIQYVRSVSREDGIPSLASYMDATKVHFNPTSHEVFHKRYSSISQLVRPSVAEFLPVI